VGDEEGAHDLVTLGRPDTVAPMTGHRLLSGTDPRLRVAPWRGDITVAHLTPGRGRPTLAAVHRAVDDLSATGYGSAITAALAVADQQPFLQAGFEVHERLHLLVRTLDDLPTVPPADLRRGHHADRARVLSVDAAAFPSFWRLDGPGLVDALAATPSARFRVASDPRGAPRVVGYAVTGRAGPRGYLQRLAVHPHHQRAGLGGALVADGLRWLRRWGAKEVLVNTQEGNEPAVKLYEALGFELRPEGLAVLRLALGRAG
jgi:ribosomal protein S18 acetylase RimI-like enzyme